MNAIFLVNLRVDGERMMGTEGISDACGNKFFTIKACTLLFDCTSIETLMDLFLIRI